MVDTVLLIGRFLLLALLYLFLFAAVRTGLGAISSPGRREGTWRLGLKVVDGPAELRGAVLDLAEPVRIGRDPDAELTVTDGYVSSAHARVEPTAGGPVLHDLGSTNGTFVNGRRIERPMRLSQGDLVEVGTVSLEVDSL